MFELAGIFIGPILGTIRDVAPIAIFLLVFQRFVLRKPIPHFKRVLKGLAYVMAGLALFLIGLEQALFPLGRLMAEQLTNPDFIRPDATAETVLTWRDYTWVYLFAAAIGFSTTVAEPSLIAVSLKAGQVSGGALNPWALRLAVAIGVSVAVTVGAFRIITGTSLAYYMMAGYAVVLVQTLLAPRKIIPLAYDSGGVTTSTVTVPLVTSLGLGLASTVPGRSQLIDGFGLIALASLFPMITVMGYAQMSELILFVKRRIKKAQEGEGTDHEVQAHYSARFGHEDGHDHQSGPLGGRDGVHGDHGREG